MANVRCPECGYIKKMEIPINKCIPFFKCENCKKFIISKECCIFCEFSDIKCSIHSSIKKWF